MAIQIKKILLESIRGRRKEIRDWLMSEWAKTRPPFYSSIDLRDAGFKIVPVDSNLYPAGFNNLCPADRRAAPKTFQRIVESRMRALGKPDARKVLIIPEANTRNTFYLENLYYLDEILRNAGFETRIGWYSPPAPGEARASKEAEARASKETEPKPGEAIPGADGKPFALKTATEKELTAHPIVIDDGVMRAGEFVPDFIVLNNDFSGGYPRELDSVKQPIWPSHAMGWHTRRKSQHFKHYNDAAGRFAEILGVDPWFIQIDTRAVDDVNFNESQGLDRVAHTVTQVLDAARDRYTEHGIDQEPFAFVKSNSGTYGMGIMMVRSADEVLTVNRREKNKMSVGKGRSAIQSVVVQEGIPTSMIVNRLAAEPAIYLAECELIGGFLRTHTSRGIDENLNAPGMVFKTLCMSDLHTLADPMDFGEADPAERELELVYGSIARLSSLAAGRELAEAGVSPPPGLPSCAGTCAR